MMDYFSILVEKVGENDTQAKIDEKIKGFHGLLTKEAAAKLIASEMGLIERSLMKISELQEGMGSVDIEGAVQEIGPLRSFPSGAMLRNIIISDGSGEGTINFWGDEGKKAGGMHLGDILEVKKGYVKMGKVNIGYKSTYSIVKSAPVLSVSEIKEGEKFLVLGKVERIEGMGGSAFVFTISDGGKSVPVSLLNSPGKGKHLQVGDSVLLEGVEYNGAEILVKGRSRMLQKKNRDDIFRGKLENIGMKGDKCLLKIGGESFVADRDTLINFLNLKELREDIDLHVIIGMKLPEIKGRNVFVKFNKKDGGKEIEYAELR